MTTPNADPKVVRKLLVSLTKDINALGDTDWAGLMNEDDTPADCAQRALTLQGLAGMLQTIAMASTQVVSDLMAGMVASAMADADDDGAS